MTKPPTPLEQDLAAGLVAHARKVGLAPVDLMSLRGYDESRFQMVEAATGRWDRHGWRLPVVWDLAVAEMRRQDAEAAER